MNQERYQKIIDQIREHPESWRQYTYHSACRTRHCIAGWAQMHRNGGTCDPWANEGTIRDEAAEWLELLPSQVTYLFFSTRTFQELEYGYRDGYNWRGEREDGKHYDPERDMTRKSKSA